MAIVEDDDSEEEEEEGVEAVTKSQAEEEKINILAETAEDHKVLGNTHYAAGKHSKALSCYSKALAALPPATPGDTWRFADHAASYYNMRSSCHIQMGSYPETVDDCNSVLQHTTVAGTRVAALLRRSFAHESMGLVSKAQSDLEEILKQDPNNGKALKSMSRLGKVADDEMVIMMKQLKEKGNKEFGAKGFATAARLYGEGIELFDKLTPAVKRRKESVTMAIQLRTNRALAFIRAKEQLQKALGDCDWVLTKEGGNDANNHKAHYRRGLALKCLSRWSDALAAFERAQALAPSKTHKAEVDKARAQCKKLGLTAKKPTNSKIQVVEEAEEEAAAPAPAKKGFKKMNIQVVDDDSDSDSDEDEAAPAAAPAKKLVEEKKQSSPAAQATKAKKQSSPKASSPKTQASSTKTQASSPKAAPSSEKKTPSKKAKAKKAASPSTPASPGSGLFKVPKTHAQFDRVWKKLKAKPEAFYTFFKSIPLSKYKPVFGGAGSLREEQLHTIFKCVRDHYCNGSEADAQSGLEVLDALTATNRFDLNIMMLSGPAEKAVASMFVKFKGLSFLDGARIEEIKKKYDS